MARRSPLTSLLALLTAAVVVCSLTSPPLAAGGAAPPTRPSVVDVLAPTSAPARLSAGSKRTLKTLVKQTRKVSKKAVRAKARKRLVKLASSAQRNATKAPCTSVGALETYRRAIASTRVRPKPKKLKGRTLDRLAGLGTVSTRATLLLLASKKTTTCGGGVTPSTRDESRTKVRASTVNHLEVAVDLPQVVLMPERVRGTSYVKLLAPDTVTPGNPGEPGIPIVSELFGVPDGAKVSVDVKKSTSLTLQDVQLFPTQPEPVDDVEAPDFFDPPFVTSGFVEEKKIKGTFPKSVADVEVLGTSRDLTIARSGIATAQYKPKTDTLTIFTKIVFDVTFENGDGFEGQVASPWESSASRLAGNLLNAELIAKFRDYQVFACGEELMVITNADTVQQAQTYADARTSDGFLTRTYVLGRSLGTTAAEIQTFIRSHLNRATCIRPSYVTIIGDDKLVPTFTNGPGGIPSDNPYSTANNSDELPDVAVGRILGNDATELDRFIAKLNQYQETPPTGPMLTKASIAAQFQDTDGAGQTKDGQENRTFIQFAERARTGLMKRNVSVDRIYKDDPSTTPTKFVDGTALPSSLRKPGFAWDGDGADISAAWNDGRFLMVHRDHGWSDGWGDPYFTTADVNLLTNDNQHLPVLMSINCSSAKYDVDDTSFVQTALVKQTGGAVAAFGDTRDSPSWHNSEIGLGFLDALLPHVLSGEGPSAQLRLGDALVSGKLRLAGLAPPSGPGISGGDGNTRNELYLWHLFGDPTMKMYGGTKQFFVYDPRDFEVRYVPRLDPNPGDPAPYQVELNLPRPLPGQQFSLVELNSDGFPLSVVGKAIGDGSVSVVIPADVSDGDFSRLAVVVNADNAIPVTIDVELPRPTRGRR